MRHILFLLLVSANFLSYSQDFFYITTKFDTISVFKPINENGSHYFCRDEKNKTFKLLKDSVAQIITIGANYNDRITKAKFYVEPTANEGYEKIILEKLNFENFNVVNTKAEADYIIKSRDYNKGVSVGKASLQILDKNEKPIGQTKECKGNLNAFNGYKNPRQAAIRKCCDEYLVELIKHLKL